MSNFIVNVRTKKPASLIRLDGKSKIYSLCKVKTILSIRLENSRAAPRMSCRGIV